MTRRPPRLARGANSASSPDARSNPLAHPRSVPPTADTPELQRLSRWIGEVLDGACTEYRPNR
eukprot:999422-Alexandrium_andersonii.AAC.1